MEGVFPAESDDESTAYSSAPPPQQGPPQLATTNPVYQHSASQHALVAPQPHGHLAGQPAPQMQIQMQGFAAHQGYQQQQQPLHQQPMPVQTMQYPQPGWQPAPPMQPGMMQVSPSQYPPPQFQQHMPQGQVMTPVAAPPPFAAPQLPQHMSVGHAMPQQQQMVMAAPPPGSSGPYVIFRSGPRVSRLGLVWCGWNSAAGFCLHGLSHSKTVSDEPRCTPCSGRSTHIGSPTRGQRCLSRNYPTFLTRRRFTIASRRIEAPRCSPRSSSAQPRSRYARMTTHSH